jgi:hypothetical protein
VVIGGSLGGLFAGLLLRSIRWDVDIYERSPHDLDSRGGGIVLQPEVLEAFRRVGVHPLGRTGARTTMPGLQTRRRITMRQTNRCWCALYWKTSPCWTTSTPSSRCLASLVPAAALAQTEIRYYRQDQAKAATELKELLEEKARNDQLPLSGKIVYIGNRFPNLPPGRIEVWFQPLVGYVALGRINEWSPVALALAELGILTWEKIRAAGLRGLQRGLIAPKRGLGSEQLPMVGASASPSCHGAVR